MRPFSDRSLRDRVTFLPADYATGLRSGVKPLYPPPGVSTRARVEPRVGRPDPDEMARMKPIAVAGYGVYTGVNPSVLAGRAIAVDDKITWRQTLDGGRTFTETGIVLRVISPPRPDCGSTIGPLWLTETQQIS